MYVLVREYDCRMGTSICKSLEDAQTLARAMVSLTGHTYQILRFIGKVHYND